MFAAPFQGNILTLDATLSEARRNDDAVMVLEQLFHIAVMDVFAVDIVQLQAAVMIGAGMQQTLVDTLISVLQ